MADQVEQPRVVAVGHRYFDEERFHEVFGEVVLEVLEGRLTQGVSARNAFRVLRGMKDKATYLLILSRTTSRLWANAKPYQSPTTPAVVARFPLPR